MRMHIVFSFALGCQVTAHDGFAQELVAPIRPLGAPVASSQATFSDDVDVRETSRGLLVYDRVGRRLVLLDSALAEVRVIADTTEATGRRHGRFTGRLMAFLGDSSLFVDPAAEAIHVLDGAGELARTMASPLGSHMSALVSGAPPGFDGSRLVYRIGTGARTGASSSVRSGNTPQRSNDSVLVVRVGLTDGTVDTVTTLYRPSPHTFVSFRASPPSIRVGPVNPQDRVDVWTMLADGSVAVLRGEDYHLELFTPAGARMVRPRVPFEWQRLTDAGKEAYLDSLQAAQERRRKAENAHPERTWGSTEMREVARRSNKADREIDVPGVDYHFVGPRELPDYRRAFGRGSVMGDARGNVWVEVQLPGAPDGRVYDVLDASGKRVDRVALPPKRKLVGFGTQSAFALAGTGDSRHIERFDP